MSIHKGKICVIGMGYVGLPLAYYFSKKYEVIGFDVDQKRVDDLNQGIDVTETFHKTELSTSHLKSTTNTQEIQDCSVFIVTVPTPVDKANFPDLGYLIKASETVGSVIKSGGMVVFESTVYPGATEEECLPVIERISGLKRGRDFKVAYSPERINPGDKEHTFLTVKKVVAGLDESSSKWAAELYGSVVDAGIFVAQSIKVAEAAKVFENTQRDLNIALVNELALICDRMDIDTSEVLEAAGTKWNFLNFKPGLVGGHCIGVDPYYLTYKAEILGYHPQVILSGRRINDTMSRYVANRTIKKMVRAGIEIKKETVLILGATFKENCPDLRNSKVEDLYNELKNFGANVKIIDPVCDPSDLQKIYGSDVIKTIGSEKFITVICAVNHENFSEIKWKEILKDNGIVIDIKNMVSRSEVEAMGFKIWKL